MSVVLWNLVGDSMFGYYSYGNLNFFVLTSIGILWALLPILIQYKLN